MKKNDKMVVPIKLPRSLVISLSVGVAMLIAALTLALMTEIDPKLIMVIYGAAYLLLQIIMLVVAIISAHAQGKKMLVNESVFSTIMLDFIQRLYLPVVICDDKGRIVWYNTALSQKCHSHSVMYGKYIDNICDATMERIVKCDATSGVQVKFITSSDSDGSLDESYNAKGYELESKGKKYFVAVFNETTELENAYKKISDDDTIVSYAMIDNLDELVQYVQDLYGNAAEDVAQILRDNVEAGGGFIRGLGRNKFMMITNNKHLAEDEAERFSVLDRIRDIHVGDTTIPITVSMGVAKISGTLYEKERAAQAALDMALQRGGDQVVVKSAEDIEYYGGKTKAVQKRTKVRSRVIANEFVMLMQKSDNIIVMGHRFADFDALASCLGVARIAKLYNKQINIVCDRSDKNLKNCFDNLISTGNYDDIFVDKLEAQDLIRSGTLAVVVDVNNISFSEAPDVVTTVKNVVIIDHHRKVAEFTIKPNIVYIEPSASSTSELIAEFLEQLLPQGALPKVEADLLYAGIMLDTKKFVHNVGIRTFSSALYLRSENANPIDAEAYFKMNIKDFISEAKFESNVVTYKSVIAISLNETDTNVSLARVNASKAADRMLSVNGVLAAFALCKVDDTVHISARSQGKINVQLILEKMGGGGHFDAAGAQVRDVTTQQALISLRNAIDEYFDENDISRITQQ